MHGKHKARATRRRGRYLALTVVGVALAAPMVASAQDWYVGAGVGQSKMKDPGDALIGNSFDDTDTGWKIYGGYNFNPNVGLELAYIDFGKFKGSAPLVNDEWKAKGIDLSVLGRVPVANQFSLFGKLGANYWTVDDSFTSPLGSGSPSKNGTDFSFGVGGQYDFTRNVGGRIEWERFDNVGDKDNTGQSDLDLLSLSVSYKF